MGNKFAFAIVLSCALLLCANAGTIYLYPSNPTIPVNSSLTFITSTQSCFLNLPYDECKNLEFSTNSETGWATVPNETSWNFMGHSKGEYNETGFEINGQTINFTKAGVWNLSVLFYNSTQTYSTNSTVTVDMPLKVKITPRIPQAVFGESVSLFANVTGGTGGYNFQWYSNNCNDKIVNATERSYTTNIIVPPQAVYPVNTPDITNSTSYCVVVNDSDNEISSNSVNISLSQSLYTPQGEVISEGNATAVLPVTIIDLNATATEVVNVTPYSVYNITLSDCRTTNNYEFGLTPSFANISLSSSQYNLYINQSLPYGNNGCYVKLLGVNWDSQLISTSSFEYYYQQPTATTSTSSSTSTISSTSTVPVTTVLPTSVSTTSIRPTTTIAPLKAKVSASNTPKASNVITASKAESDIGGFALMMGIIVVIAIGAFALLYKKKRRYPPSSGNVDKSGMVNL